MRCDEKNNYAIISKARDGEIGKVKLTFLKTITRFENYADEKSNNKPYSD